MTSNQENERSGIKKVISKVRGKKPQQSNPASPSITLTPGASPSVTPTPLAPHRSSPLSLPVIPHTISPRSSIPASSPLPPTTAPIYYPPAWNTPSQVPQSSQYPFMPPPPYVGPSTWYPPTTGPPQYYFPGYFPYAPNQTPGAGPSTPCPPCSQPAQGHSQSSTGTEEGRIVIQPEGGTFYPHRGATHQINEIIQARFDAPYSSWKKIPVVVRDMWFKDFERSFQWLPDHHRLIRRNFDKLGSARLKDMLNTARRSGKRPDWIGEEIWDDLVTIWESTEYIQRGEQNKKKRVSDCDGLGLPLHTGGSIPTTEHKRKMEKTLGREPTLSELRTHIHQRRSDSSWVDLKSANIHEKYTQLKETTSTQSSAEGSSSQESKVELWKQVTGGYIKGKFYGVGSHDTTLNMPSTYNMGASIDAHIQKIIDTKVDYTISTIKKHIQKRMQEMEDEHQLRMQKMYYSTFYPPPPPPPQPNQGDVKDEEEDDEEDNDEEN